jgi:DNA-binding transcriptional LysR family regulator
LNTAADAGQFSEAAADLSITQQAVSKRIAALEKDLGVWLFTGIVAGTEWAAYYDELATAFGLTIDAVGPNFGTEPLLDVIADSAELATLVGEQTRLLWPADYGLRRIAVRDPTPVYPHSLIWRGGDPHPALATLRDYLVANRRRQCAAGTWAPRWAQR